MQLDEEEMLRLLLVDGGNKDRGVRISRGAARLMRMWPGHVASAIWFALSIISFFSVISLLVIVLIEQNCTRGLVHCEPEHKINKQGDESMKLELYSQFLSKNNSSHKQQDLQGLDVMNKVAALDPKRTIFYLVKDKLREEEACAIESVLRLCPDKTIFLLSLESETHLNKTDLSAILDLTDRYSNLQIARIDGSEYLRGSPFEGLWNHNEEKALQASKVWTVWQFGGAVLSANLLLNSRKMFDMNNEHCTIDNEVMFCPDQCSAYIYELMETMLKHWNHSSNIIDISLRTFCGSDKFIKSGCPGVKRLNACSLCNNIGDGQCTFIRINNIKTNHLDWKDRVRKFCPKSII